ncbi:MAG: aspartate--tRNA ligase [Cryomorphaceae bacterium]|nr:aspartate--tRNA ligase [Cryomorphaceae bacterium]MDG1889145.1 aspartate--tRNA ligase [Flavobacteriaceae bacterium]MBT6736431.1 aspartate--tRNA ligase [Cryomorphaceae bacterium]MBT6934957.1 aspartate--tRNA ligase [Cryomorphaceae bacterium]MBT7018327.1 aspartate--tRNA ligase [Cryomorphaceae bacterium]
MNRTNNCGELSKANLNQTVKLSGWVNKIREKGFIIWIDLRDRYGVTQLVFDKERSSEEIFSAASGLGREFVVEIEGSVIERKNANEKIKTGEIEILVSSLTILNKSLTPPFTIENESDGGEELRMKYRYLDIRREPVKENLIFRHELSLEVRNYLSENSFIDIETPYLIKSTPEGARDFIVPSRLNPDHYYALPQSPQIFKQLLMVGGIDKYYQIVKCFRDEDLRADRQPEFTQIDCEMSFVNQEDIFQQFEGLMSRLFSKFLNKTDISFERMTYKFAIENYGIDKPDLRYGLKIKEISNEVKGKGFQIFDNNDFTSCILIENKSEITRKEIDNITDWVKRPQIGATGLLWIKHNTDSSIKSSFDKFFSESDLKYILDKVSSKPGDIIFIMSGDKKNTLEQMGSLRVELAKRFDLVDHNKMCPLWVTDFPLFEWDEDEKRFFSMHHPFTSPKQEFLDLLESDPLKVIANAYDLVLNGNEIGGGSIRIHDFDTQMKIFELLGMDKQEYTSQFGFLIEALKYGAPPHGGIAFGLDRLAAVLKGKDVIRDFIAFPKNNSGKDLMIDAPSKLTKEQLKDLSN